MPYSSPQPLDKTTFPQQWRHLLPGAMALSGTAGYINSVVLGFFATPVSHMSGAVSHLGLDIAQSHRANALGSLLIIIGFLLGAMLSGVCVGAIKLVPSRRYGVVMMIEGLLLFASVAMMERGSSTGPMLAAMACGLQNGMSSSYCGLMIRTTHVSGVVTDLGVMLGHWLRHQRIVVWKLKFLLALLLSFGSGGGVGAYTSLLYGPRCLLVAAIGCASAGALYFAVMHNDKERNAARENAEQETPVPRTSIFPDA